MFFYTRVNSGSENKNPGNASKKINWQFMDFSG